MRKNLENPANFVHLDDICYVISELVPHLGLQIA